MLKSHPRSPWYVVVLYGEMLFLLIMAAAAGPIIYLIHFGAIFKAPQNGLEVQMMIWAVLSPSCFGYFAFKIGVYLRAILGMGSAESVQLPHLESGQRGQAVAIGLIFIVGSILSPLFAWDLGKFQVFWAFLGPSLIGIVFGVCVIIWAASLTLADRRQRTKPSTLTRQLPPDSDE